MQIEVPLPDTNARKELFDAELQRDGVKVEAALDHYIRDTEKWNASKITQFLKVGHLQSSDSNAVFRLFYSKLL